jgi:hypothetical protein
VSIPVWLDARGRRVPTRPCPIPKCDRQWPVYRYRFDHLRMIGWGQPRQWEETKEQDEAINYVTGGDGLRRQVRGGGSTQNPCASTPSATLNKLGLPEGDQ